MFTCYRTFIFIFLSLLAVACPGFNDAFLGTDLVTENTAWHSERLTDTTIPSHWRGFKATYHETRLYYPAPFKDDERSSRNPEIRVELLETGNRRTALGAYVITRNLTDETPFTIRPLKGRWGHFYRDTPIAAFWQNNRVLLAHSSEELTRDAWTSFFNSITVEWDDPAPRPREFALFLREETNLREIQYSHDQGIKDHLKLKKFFYTPYKTDSFTGYFGFRLFASALEAANYFNSFTAESSGTLTRWNASNNRSYQVVLRSESTLYTQNTAVFVLVADISEKQKKTELNKIWEAWGD